MKKQFPERMSVSIISIKNFRHTVNTALYLFVRSLVYIFFHILFEENKIFYNRNFVHSGHRRCRRISKHDNS